MPSASIPIRSVQVSTSWTRRREESILIHGLAIALPEDWSMPDIKDNAEFIPPRLIFFDVWLLRIALETYLKLPATVQIKKEGGEAENQPLYNHERGIDDFILIVALMGNDFIPGLPLPNWDIHEGAINVVVDAWQRSTINQKGYITKNGKIRLDRLENLFRTLAPLEDFPPEVIGELSLPVTCCPYRPTKTTQNPTSTQMRAQDTLLSRLKRTLLLQTYEGHRLPVSNQNTPTRTYLLDIKALLIIALVTMIQIASIYLKVFQHLHLALKRKKTLPD